MLVICPQCDLALCLPPLAGGQRARCPRCMGELANPGARKLDAALAATLTAILLLLLMNVFPLVSLRVQGADRALTLWGAVRQMYDQGRAPLAALVLATTMLGPLAELLLLALVLVPLRLQRLRRAGGHWIGVLQFVRPWSMVEVFMLGVLVALVKLAALAEIILGPALWACACLILTLSLLKILVRAEDLWAWAQAEPAP